MGRYVGLLALLLGALLLVNIASDVLYAKAVAAHGEGDDEPIVAEAAMPTPLPLTGLVRTPTGRWRQGRMLEASAPPIMPSAQSCTEPMVSVRR